MPFASSSTGLGSDDQQLYFDVLGAVTEEVHGLFRTFRHFYPQRIAVQQFEKRSFGPQNNLQSAKLQVIIKVAALDYPGRVVTVSTTAMFESGVLQPLSVFCDNRGRRFLFCSTALARLFKT